MSNANLIISEKNGVCNIRVSGRANFECGMPLRTFSKNFTSQTAKIIIDLGECESMDSTFMGILTMIAIKSRKTGTALELLNASDFTRSLLRGLGVEKMFTFVSGDGTGATAAASEINLGDARINKVDAARTVVDAHKTLMDVSLDNIAKFEKVVEYAESDLEKFEKDEAEAESEK